MRRAMSEGQGRLLISLVLVSLAFQLTQAGERDYGKAILMAVVFVFVFMGVSIVSAVLEARRLGPLPPRAPGDKG